MSKRKRTQYKRQSSKISKSSSSKSVTLSSSSNSKKHACPQILSKERSVSSKGRYNQEKKFRRRRFFLTFFFCLLVTFCGVFFLFRDTIVNHFRDTNTVVPNQKEEESSELSLVMVGDVLIHSAVYGDAKTGNGYDFRPMFESVKPWISSFDLAYCNQETILGGMELGLSSYPSFNSPYEVGDALIDAGFNLVSLSTNHTLDRGEKAILNSRNYWNNHQKEVLASGSYSSFEERERLDIREKNGISYTMLSYTDLTNGQRIPSGKSYLLNLYTEETVRKDVERVRDQSDIVIVSLHFGEEYSHFPTARQKQVAQYLADLGVDIIIGTHPHVIQPIEFIGKTMVVYSLGNFISAQRGVEKLTGLMASVTIKKQKRDGVTTLSLENPVAKLVYTASDIKGNYRKNFKLYPYSDLNDHILSNYKQYEKKYMDIVTSYGAKIEKR